MAYSYYFIRPNADIKADWTETPGGTAYTTVDDAVFEPTAADTGDFIQTASTANLCILNLETFTKPAGEITRKVSIWAYGVSTAGGGFTVVLKTASEETLTSLTSTATSAGWATSGDTPIGNLTQATIDGLKLSIYPTQSISTTVYAVYVAVITNLHTDLPLMGVG